VAGQPDHRRRHLLERDESGRMREEEERGLRLNRYKGQCISLVSVLLCSKGASEGGTP
jgi:hypothetical protein